MRKSVLILATLVATTLTLADGADARRMGGGRSFGAQRESVAPAKPAAAPSPAAPSNSAAQPASPAAAIPPKAAPAAAPAPSGMSRWLGPIAGIAAGLGLAALLSHFGLSEGFGSILLIGLAIMAGVFLLRMFMARRSPTSTAPRSYAGATAEAATYDSAPVRYEPSPNPAWRTADAASPDTSIVPGAAATAEAPTFGVARKALPPGFDAVAFAREAKRQYIQVQAFYDQADREALANVMTAEMGDEVRRELDERVGHQPTEIVTLEADVLDVATEGDKYWVSVRFTGLVREDGQPVPTSIDEVWNLTKPIKGASGWLLAGISQLA